MHIFKCFENQSDTYHDTRTHYLMEQDPLLLQNQADGMDVATVDRWEALKKGRALQGQAQVNMALRTPCLGLVGLKTYSPQLSLGKL
jgi:hypothetical protein